MTTFLTQEFTSVAPANLSGSPEAFMHVKPSVQAEVADLIAEGYDVSITDTPDQYRPDTERQELIDTEIAYLETSENGAAEFRDHPGISKWAPLTKRAIALHTLYNPMSETVGQGIDSTIYDRPLFAGNSAKELMVAQLPNKAQTFIDAYEAFVPAEIEDQDPNEVGSRDFFRGVKDAEAVRTRATAATELVSDYISTNPLLSERQDLVSASLACGAAGPVYEMVNNLGEQGHNFSDVILVDQDPMALATAQSIAENSGIEDKVRLEIRDLLSENLTDYIAPNSVDVVDLLGLFEYIPNDERMGHWAAALLGKVKEIVRPGGYIVFGNMVNERPQQDFFSKVVKWPRLQQRTVHQVQSIVEEAGFDPKDMQVRIPTEGVYAVYGIKVPAVMEQEKSTQSVAAELGQTALERY